MIIDKNNPVPLYHQIKKYYRDQIKEEKIREGSKMPSEPEMMEKFNVSRSTVRKALGELEKEGYIEKFHGKRTIVSKPKIAPLAALKSFSEDMKNAGFKPSYKTQTIELCFPPMHISNFFNIEDTNHKTTLFMKRVLLADSKAIAIQNVYLPIKLIEPIKEFFTKDYLDNNSMYKLFEEKLNINFRKAEEDISAIQADEEEKELLDLNSQIPLLLINRKTFNDKNDPIEYARLIYRADIYSYKINLTAD